MTAELAIAEKNLESTGFLDLQVDPTMDLYEEIEKLKKEKNEIINYWWKWNDWQRMDDGDATRSIG